MSVFAKKETVLFRIITFFKKPLVLVVFAVFLLSFFKRFSSFNRLNNTSKLTVQQASIYADQLLSAMDVQKPIYGTDEQSIIKIFNKIDSEDFKLIFNQFGKKPYNGYGLKESVLDFFWSDKNLVEWLKEEININQDRYLKLRKVITGAGFVI